MRLYLYCEVWEKDDVLRVQNLLRNLRKHKPEQGTRRAQNNAMSPFQPILAANYRVRMLRGLIKLMQFVEENRFLEVDHIVYLWDKLLLLVFGEGLIVIEEFCVCWRVFNDHAVDGSVAVGLEVDHRHLSSPRQVNLKQFRLE